jgi:hypothetical protein
MHALRLKTHSPVVCSQSASLPVGRSACLPDFRTASLSICSYVCLSQGGPDAAGGAAVPRVSHCCPGARGSPGPSWQSGGGLSRSAAQ